MRQPDERAAFAGRWPRVYGRTKLLDALSVPIQRIGWPQASVWAHDNTSWLECFRAKLRQRSRRTGRSNRPAWERFLETRVGRPMTAIGARIVGNKAARPLVALTTFAILSSARATLHPEPANPIDANAVAVLQFIGDQHGSTIQHMQYYRPQRSYPSRRRHHK